MGFEFSLIEKPMKPTLSRNLNCLAFCNSLRTILAFVLLLQRIGMMKLIIQ